MSETASNTTMTKPRLPSVKKRTNRLDALESFSSRLEVKGRSLWSDARHRFLGNKAAVISTIVLFLIVLMVIFAPFFSRYGYPDLDWSYMSQGPDWSNGHIFGTDNLGRDVFTRTMVGGRISLMIGLLGALVSCSIGVIYGALAGFIGGRTDTIMMRIVEILYSLPFMFLVILLVTFLGRSIFLIFLAIGAVSWLEMARIIRGQAISLKKKEFIEAAHVSGTSTWKIIIKHIVPNTLGLVAIYLSLLIPSLILFESFLSFLGLGVQEPMTSWGAMVNDGAQAMETNPSQLIFPVMFLTITLFCFNFIGDGLRDALDPKDR